MTMRIYASTDASAPTLQGVVGSTYSGSSWSAGSLLELLNQILVKGYGSQTAAGWTLPYNGTSKGVFKQGGGCNMFMRVLDDGSLTAGAREAQFYGGEAASDVDTLTGQFPTSSQVSGYLKCRKSDTADSTTRPWVCFADAKTFYLYIYPGFSTAYLGGMAFGDFTSYFPGDLFNCIAIGRETSAAVDTPTNDRLDFVNGEGTFSTITGHYTPRGYNQLGTSVNVAKAGLGLFTATSGNASGAVGLNWPNPEESGMYLNRCFVTDSVTTPTNNVRGHLRGFWVCQNALANAGLNTTYSGTGTLAGKSFRILGLRGPNTANGRYIMETSDTWDT